MKTITDFAPFFIGPKKVIAVSVKSITFRLFVGCLERAQLKFTDSSPQEYQMLLSRERRAAQFEMKCEDGSVIENTPEAMAQIPRKLFVRLSNIMDEGEFPPGKKINAGDGIDTPVLFKLGVPISYSIVGEGDETIKEIEFVAATGGDIERVLASGNVYQQTLCLLEDCAAPVGTEGNLLRLPAWAVDSLSVEDGLAIAQTVLPDFV